ncbi:glycosyltransferase, group 2 family protein [Leptospira inadai serovar Lyme str. 10]|uniref:Glycosyltransferase, group 2 family protein n=2 Tax=Leptospira inadai serovar Lyme TaxID=293084 RepID=V6HD47_9LEPT|nr:glycosyltransferase family 2 protein [Leptospira inadai]EQA36923.1 glycosyltransferase, group 2 family protein [Leptospira inadai serovar Lyme str. 10]PNV75812.1 glycosyl transferase [Leptospira inadai serovar Lyme]
MTQLVSIIMPVYNAEKFIAASIESVLNQKYGSWELLLVDDQSKDSSREIMQTYSKKDSRIKSIFKERNSGSADSRNQGILAAKGRYIAFLDADDLWDPEFLSEQIKLMQDEKVAFSFSSYRIVDESDREILKPYMAAGGPITYRQNLLYNRVGLLTAIYDTETLGKMYFDVSLKSLRDDYALWLDILKKIPYSIGNPKILASYRVRKGALTSNKKNVILPHFRMLKNREKLGWISAAFYTGAWGLVAMKKYYFNRI